MANNINVRFVIANSICESIKHLNYIQIAAIYLRGKNDIFFYEFLYDICGDKLLPFMLYYASKFITKFPKENKTENWKKLFIVNRFHAQE